MADSLKLDPGRSLVVVDDDRAEMKPLLYLWDPVLPLGKLVHFAGRSSGGKSPVTIDLIARISRGGPWPDGQENPRGPRRAILLNIEDGFEDTILPRYYLAGGARGSLRYVRGVKIQKEETIHDGLVALDRDISLLCGLARDTENLGIIVIDPITNYLGKLKMNAEEDARQILTPLAGLADELGIVVITVGHLNKNDANTDPLARVMGAAAFAGVARSVYLFGEDKDRPDEKYAHIMSPARGNKNTSFKYRTEAIEQEITGVRTKIVRIAWDGICDATAEDAVERAPRKQLNEEQEAGLSLREFLKARPVSASQCQDFLRQSGFKLEVMNLFRVRKHGGIGTRPNGQKKEWFLIDGQALGLNF